MLHAEQMIALKGGISLEENGEGQPIKLMNGTELSLKSALLLRNLGNQISYSWLGDIDPRTARDVIFVSEGMTQMWKHWDAQPSTQSRGIADQDGETEQDSLWVGGMLAEIVLKLPLMPGQSRLFAYIDERPGELKIKPAEDQFDGRCVVVAHLTPPILRDISPDVSIWSRPVEPADTATETADENQETEGILGL